MPSVMLEYPIFNKEMAKACLEILNRTEFAGQGVEAVMHIKLALSHIASGEHEVVSVTPKEEVVPET